MVDGGCPFAKRLNLVAGTFNKRNTETQARECVGLIVIMIITPDEVFRSAMVLHFQEKDYALTIPEPRQDVTSLVEKNVPKVIVLDMAIAGTNGPTILEALRAISYGGKIIVISGPSNRPLMVNLQHQKVDQVLRRTPADPIGPFIDQLESIIRVMFHEEISRKPI